MSSEPARRPDDDETAPPAAEASQPAAEASQPAAEVSESAGEASSPDVPGPDEVLPPDADAPIPNPDHGQPRQGAAGTGTDADAIEREAAVVTADAAAAETTAEAVATIDAASDDAAAEAKTHGEATAEGATAAGQVAAAEGAPAAEGAQAAEQPATDDATATADVQAERRAARRRAVGGAVKTVLTVVFGVALLVGGIAIGNYVFQATRPGPVGLASDDPGSNLGQPSAAAQELIAALAVNDADSIRSSLDREPHIDLTNEMTKYGIQRVDSVDVLGTSVDGPRSATEILMHYQREDGISFAINLVILVNDGKIEGFR